MSKPIAVYLAARYSRNAEMRGVRDALVAAFGMEVTSRWIDLHPDIVGEFGGDLSESQGSASLNGSPEKCAVLGQHDLADLDRADWVVSFTGTGGRRGGRHVQFGYALARSKRLMVVGPREHVFHTLPEVEHFAGWLAFSDWLARTDWDRS